MSVEVGSRAALGQGMEGDKTEPYLVNTETQSYMYVAWIRPHWDSILAVFPLQDCNTLTQHPCNWCPVTGKYGSVARETI